MRLIPTIGTDILRFGASYDDVVRVMGQPNSIQKLHDFPTHPKGRRNLKYDLFSMTVGSQIGLFGIELRIVSEPVFLWDVAINGFTTEQFTELLAMHGVEVEASQPNWDLFSKQHGILAYFDEDRIYNLELTIPESCPSDY